MIICFGELLIDFVSTQAGVTLAEAPAFKKAPGGAPANVAVGLARLGVKVGYMGKVGDEDFGHFLADTLTQNGVDTRSIRFDKTARTALAFVSNKEDGEREFMFYRHPSADMLLTPEEIDTQLIEEADIFCFGSIPLTTEPTRSATLHAVETAQQSNTLILYDPNLRMNLWKSAEAAHQGIMEAWPAAHIAKVSRDELAFLSGKDDIAEGVEALWHDTLRLILITDGPHGAYYHTPDFRGHVGGFEVTPVDTTGAGDGFVAGFLAKLHENPALIEDETALRSAVRYGNAVGALATTERGAIPAMPSLEQVHALFE